MGNVIKLLVVSIAAMLHACGAPADAEKNIKIIALEHHEEFISKLEKAGIPFRIAGDRQVFYSSRDTENVQKITNSILGISGELQVQGVIIPLLHAPKVALRLTEERIPYEVIYDDERATFKWPVHLNDNAQSIVGKVMEENGA